MIYPNDHTPPHVHVWKAGNEARVLLSPVELWAATYRRVKIGKRWQLSKQTVIHYWHDG
jgi:hypothetical protein